MERDAEPSDAANAKPNATRRLDQADVSHNAIHIK
jgi:hypothetical protein